MLLQLTIYGIINGCIYALVAIGFSLVYQISGFFHFAYAAIVIYGPYFTLLFNKYIGLPILISIFLAIILSSLLGLLINIFIYRPLRKKNASSLIFLLASLGVYIVLQNIIAMIFGDSTKSIRSSVVHEGISVFDARITPNQVAIICISIALVVGVSAWLRISKIGIAMQAVANDSELANISGIDSEKIMSWTFIISSALASIAGILIAFDIDISPTMGLNVFLMGIVAVIIGGVRSISGMLVGALFIGLVKHLAVWKISSQWQDAIIFIILFIFLIIRPKGFIGKSEASV